MSNSAELMNFDESIEPTEFPFQHKGKNYILREASGDAVIEYRKSILRATKRGKDGSLSVGAELPEGEINLIANCISQIEDGKEKKVTKTTVLNWSSKVVSWAYNKIKEISDLGDKSVTGEDKEKMEELQKNGLSFMEDGES